MHTGSCVRTGWRAPTAGLCNSPSICATRDCSTTPDMSMMSAFFTAGTYHTVAPSPLSMAASTNSHVVPTGPRYSAKLQKHSTT